MKQLVFLFVDMWLVCTLLIGCATPITTAQPHATLTVVVPTATEDPFVINVCHTCDVQQRRVQATVTH